MPTNLQDVFAAIAFAEENEHETALNLMSRTTERKSLFKTLGKKIGKFRKTVDSYQEKITFAQAGSFELIDEQPIEQEKTKSKLLVVGNHGNFSDDIIEYALDMAKRLSYEIIALNSAPFTCNTLKLFSSEQRKLCSDFEKLAKENVQSFKEKAEDKGINFKHVIIFNNSDEAQEEVFKEYKNIAFVISNEIEDRETDEQREGLSNRVFVYSMV